MEFKDPDAIIRLHDTLIDEFGGEKGLISKSILLSSLARPFHGMADGIEFYPTLEEKASVLIHAMIRNHPFVDGNKRTAAQITKIFLRENGYDLDFTNDDIVEFVLNIANNRINLVEITDWITIRISKL